MAGIIQGTRCVCHDGLRRRKPEKKSRVDSQNIVYDGSVYHTESH